MCRLDPEGERGLLLLLVLNTLRQCLVHLTFQASSSSSSYVREPAGSASGTEVRAEPSRGPRGPRGIG